MSSLAISRATARSARAFATPTVSRFLPSSRSLDIFDLEDVPQPLVSALQLEEAVTRLQHLGTRLRDPEQATDKRLGLGGGSRILAGQVNKEGIALIVGEKPPNEGTAFPIRASSSSEFC